VDLGEGWRGFCPNSHFPLPRLVDPESLVGVEGSFSVLDYDVEGSLKVSRRNYLREGGEDTWIEPQAPRPKKKRRRKRRRKSKKAP
jgi:hypothetical protein